jgi:hypothetical protein
VIALQMSFHRPYLAFGRFEKFDASFDEPASRQTSGVDVDWTRSGEGETGVEVSLDDQKCDTTRPPNPASYSGIEQWGGQSSNPEIEPSDDRLLTDPGELNRCPFPFRVIDKTDRIRTESYGQFFAACGHKIAAIESDSRPGTADNSLNLFRFTQFTLSGIAFANSCWY